MTHDKANPENEFDDLNKQIIVMEKVIGDMRAKAKISLAYIGGEFIVKRVGDCWKILWSDGKVHSIPVHILEAPLNAKITLATLAPSLFEKMKNVARETRESERVAARTLESFLNRYRCGGGTDK